MSDERPTILVEVVQPKKSTLERITSAVPLFISVIALSLSIWSVWQSRIHDRLSMRPSVRFFREKRTDAPEVGLFIENNGLGPALIRNVRVYLDGKQIEDFNVVYRATAGIYRERHVGWSETRYDFVLRAGSRESIYVTPGSNIADTGGFRDLLDRRLFAIATACSFYEECHSVCIDADARCDDDEARIADRKM